MRPKARGRTRIPSLTDYDLADTDGYQNTGARVYPPNLTGGARHVQPSEVIHCGGCWCGEPNGHDWPGKADGAPHPR